jgi:uncharacterized DUF497 family protein
LLENDGIDFEKYSSASLQYFISFSSSPSLQGEERFLSLSKDREGLVEVVFSNVDAASSAA